MLRQEECTWRSPTDNAAKIQNPLKKFFEVHGYLVTNFESCCPFVQSTYPVLSKTNSWITLGGEHAAVAMHMVHPSKSRTDLVVGEYFLLPQGDEAEKAMYAPGSNTAFSHALWCSQPEWLNSLSCHERLARQMNRLN